MAGALALGGAAAAVAVGGGGGGAAGVSFARDVQPIFDAKCVSCHPTSYPYLDLRPGRAYRELVHVLAETNTAFERVLPGRPELSYLLTHPPDPSNANLLSAPEQRAIERWILAGAPER